MYQSFIHCPLQPFSLSVKPFTRPDRERVLLFVGLWLNVLVPPLPDSVSTHRGPGLKYPRILGGSGRSDVTMVECRGLMPRLSVGIHEDQDGRATIGAKLDLPELIAEVLS